MTTKTKQSSTLDKPRTDWVITLPATASWSDYERELRSVKDWSGVLNFRVPFKPSAKKGDRCYLVYQGQVRGWMMVMGAVKHPYGFFCGTNGQFWNPGNYIQRSGPWHSIKNGQKIRGFQGIRRFQHAESSMPDRCPSCSCDVDKTSIWCSTCGRYPS